jgi:hypothetical protein
MDITTMAWVLTHRVTRFCWSKMALTSLGVWLLAVHQQWALAATGL